MENVNTAEESSTKGSSVTPWPRIVLALMIGLAVQALVGVVYVILRYGPEFRAEIVSVWEQAASFVFVLPIICAVGVRKMPAMTSLSMIAFASVLSNAGGAVGAYLCVYLLSL